MQYPTLATLDNSRHMIDQFRGYNHNLRIGGGEFYDMKNMTPDHFPILAPRGKRGLYTTAESPQGMIAKDNLCYVDGTDFVMGEYRIDMGLSTAEEDCPKQLISMGAYVVIMPDKKYINTANITDFGNIEAEFTTQAPVSFTLCKMDGSDYETDYTQSDEPADPANMTLWVDTSTTPHSLKQWSETSGMWVSIATTYVKISSSGIGTAFEQYDGIDITGLKDVVLIDNASGLEIENTKDLAALEGAAVVWDRSDDYIVVVGMLDITRTITNPVTISRKMPSMDFVIESENRLWGCRYGIAANGEVVNELYASKLGDFKNWNCFMGLSTDSYSAAVGTDGVFTGAITHLGYPLFFKENFIHKVYGNFPANFQIQTTACRGVQRGCERSLAIVNEMLYYKARHAVCAYDGSLPTEISYVMGEVRYSDAVAGSHGNKYYISMADTAGVYHLFVYDTAKGMWHREDNLRADAFCSCRDELFCMEHGTNKIITMLGSGTQDTKAVDWMVQTGPLGTDEPDMKYISRLVLRMSLDIGTRVRFFIQYDSIGGWEPIGMMSGTSLRSFSIPIRPRRCDHFRLRIEGVGDARIYSETKTIERGSDIS